MEIKLKKINISLALSEETIAFVADIYINGYKAGCAKNEGCGGNTHLNHYDDKGRELMIKAEAHCKTLPDMECFGSKIEMNLEHFVDNVIEELSNEKENKKQQAKFNKDMLLGVLTGEPNAYNMNYWKGHTIATILSTAKGVEFLTKKLVEIKAKDVKILNTNIPEHILNPKSLIK